MDSRAKGELVSSPFVFSRPVCHVFLAAFLYRDALTQVAFLPWQKCIAEREGV